MKTNNFIRYIPFLSTLLLILFLFISNQKVNTKLRILIWNTPSLSLGSYLAISTGAGFLLSYITTSNIAYLARRKGKKSIKYKPHYADEISNKYTFSNLSNPLEKTLIERDINDPLPTVNAQFRVIGKTEGYNKNLMNNNTIQHDTSNELEDTFHERDEGYENINQKIENSSDWNDHSYSDW